MSAIENLSSESNSPTNYLWMEWLGSKLSNYSHFPKVPTTEILPIVLILRELSHVLDSAKRGPTLINGSDQASLVTDFLQAEKHIGADLKKEITESLANIRTVIVSSQQFKKALRPGETQYSLENLVQKALSELTTTGSLLAAWADLQRSYAKKKKTECRELALLQFRYLAETQGFNWKKLFSDIHTYLRTPADLLNEMELISQSFLTADERLSLVLNLLQTPPQHGCAIVWLGFSHAHIGWNAINNSSITFYSSQDFSQGVMVDPQLAKNAGYNVTDEMNVDNAFKMYFNNGKIPTEAVAVRISLEDVPVQHANDIAQRRVTQLLDLIDPNRGWRLMQGGGIFDVENNVWITCDRFRESRFHKSSVPDHFGQSLTDIDPLVTDALFLDTFQGKEVQDLVQWHAEVQRISDPKHRVSLLTRTLEKALPTRGDEWVKKAKELIISQWAENIGREYLWKKVYQSFSDSEKPNVDLIEKCFPHIDGQSFHIDWATICESFPEILTAVEPKSLQYIEIAEFANCVKDSRSLHAYLMSWHKRGEILLQRAIRQRNEAIHGTVLCEEIAEVADNFLTTIIWKVLVTYLVAATEKKFGY